MCWVSIRQFGRIWLTEPAPPAELEDVEPWSGRGWQHVAALKVECQHREELFVHMEPSHRAQVRSQAGPGASTALSVAPTHYLTRIPLHLFRVVCLFRCTPAGVAAKSTSLSTTEDRVHEQACFFAFFWAALLEMSMFYPTRNFGHWCSSSPGHSCDLPKCQLLEP